MTAVFQKLLIQSINTSNLMLFLFVIRICFRKMSAKIRCILWALPAISLVFPVSCRIPLPVTMPALSNSNLYLNANFLSDINQNISKSATDLTVDTLNALPEFLEKYQFINSYSALMTFGSIIWLICCISLLMYMLLSQIRLHKILNVSLQTTDHYRICDNISNAFVIGIIHPCIYLPSDLDTRYVHAILLHEQAHINRKDYWWKPLGYFLLSLYCFHPLVWVSYFLFCRDIELACDEKVIQNMNIKERISYSNTLLHFSFQNKKRTASVLAFGKSSIKKRIKCIMNYKKASAITTCFSLIVCAFLIILCITRNGTNIPELPANTSSLSKQCSFGFSNLSAGETNEFPQILSISEDSTINWNVTYLQMGLFVEIILTDENGKEYIQTIAGGNGSGYFSKLSAGNYRIAIRNSEKNLQNKIQHTLTGTTAFSY